MDHSLTTAALNSEEEARETVTPACCHRSTPFSPIPLGFDFLGKCIINGRKSSQSTSSALIQLPAPSAASAADATTGTLLAGPNWDGRFELRETGTPRRQLGLGEFGGILDPDSTTGSNASATSGRTPSDAASEMSIAGFDVNSFHDGVTGSSGASGGWNPPVTTASMHSRPPATPTVPKKTRLATSKKSAEAIPPSSDAATTALVDAAYTQFSESNELDLRTDKLSKDRSERCQFPDCPNRARVSQSYGKYCNRHVIVAPCGFPGCRDKAMERASMCATHMEQGKEALQEILNARSQNVPVCKMSGCFKNDQGRGYCRGHEKLLMATGRLPPHINKRRLNSAYTMCSYPDCNKHSQRHHLCRTHGNLIIKQAQELADRPGATESYEEILGRLHKEIRRCTHENCSKNSQRDRLCTTHYYEKHHPQKDDSTSASTAKEKGFSRAVEICRILEDCVWSMPKKSRICPKPRTLWRSVPSGENTGLFSDDVDSETKPGVFVLDEKPQATGVPSRPICVSKTFLAACGLDKSQLIGYPLNSPSVGVDQPEGKILLCRVSSCGQDSVRGGLCSTHLRAFRTGSLSVDNLKLNSQAQQLQREQELAEAAAVAATAAEAKLTSPSASGKARKYYCRVDGCSKQAQKRNLCKRHYRLQEGVPTGKSYPEASSSGPLINFAPGLPQTGLLRQRCNANSKLLASCLRCRRSQGSNRCRCPEAFRQPTAAAMERIYSAFFTSERRREPPELTAAVLELHNETQKSQRQPPLLRPGGDGGKRRPDAKDESPHEAKQHAAPDARRCKRW
ncbi:hypothetical protein GQ600_13343 [Phytophthora cactorum]|nr:hypothetical protein GQ600_13343 [Phytophthora cactorum]